VRSIFDCALTKQVCTHSQLYRLDCGGYAQKLRLTSHRAPVTVSSSVQNSRASLPRDKQRTSSAPSSSSVRPPRLRAAGQRRRLGARAAAGRARQRAAAHRGHHARVRAGHAGVLHGGRDRPRPRAAAQGVHGERLRAQPVGAQHVVPRRRAGATSSPAGTSTSSTSKSSTVHGLFFFFFLSWIKIESFFRRIIVF
jgi:hypothetical protein